MIENPPLPKRVYLGVFILSLATLVYETLLTRIFSVTMAYHFAFVAISLALFGMTLGAILVYLFPAAFTKERAPLWIARSAALFSAAIVYSSLTHLSIPFTLDNSAIGLYTVALTYATLSLPFVFSGICICLALTRFPRRIGALYAADLIGASLGCILLIVLLEAVDGPTAILVVAALAASGAWLFASMTDARRLRRIAAGWGLFLAACAGVNGWLGMYQMAPLHLVWVKGQYEERPLYEKWNSFSRIAIFGDPKKLTLPAGLGLSVLTPPGEKIGQLKMNLDAGVETDMTSFHGDLSPVEYLRYDMTNLVHYIRPDSDMLVLGSGGGRDILSALVFRQKSVVGVEINRNINYAVNGVFGDFTGHLDRLPNVSFVDDEARSYVARSPNRFNIIQASLVDTFAATSSGAFVLTENSLYTVEAWQLFLDHLAPQGVLSFSRWYFSEHPSEMYRLASLASEALAGRGVPDPAGHIIIVRNDRSIDGVDTNIGIGTILVSPSPFSDSDIDTVEATAARLHFDVVYSPRRSLDPALSDILLGHNRETVQTSVPINIRPPHDDSPFFFLMVRPQDAILSAWRGADTTVGEVHTVMILLGLFVVVLALTLLSILIPLALTTKRDALRGSASLFAFFGSIGLGYMLIEVSQTQRLIIFLGHPTYSLSVVLFTLLIASGLGSLSTQLWRPLEKPRAGLIPMGVLIAVLAVFGIVMPAVASAGEGAVTPVRILLAVLLLFPPGFLMGMAFPLGMRLAAARAPSITAWFWGVNGAASVCASVLAVVIALSVGISAAFWTGVGCYMLASAAFGWLVLRPGRVPAEDLLRATG
jgi:hypothetical protein